MSVQTDVLSPDYLSMIGGSHRATVVADAWWDGRLVAKSLPITGGSLSISAGQAVRSRLSLSLADNDGLLVPNAAGALSSFGGEIRIRGGMVRGPIRDLCPLGRFAIQDSDADEVFAQYQSPAGPTVSVSRGALISLEAVDFAQKLDDEKLLSARQPTQPTVFLELARLARGVVPWKAPGNVTDKSLAANAVTYEDDRAKAVQDLADLLDCDPIMTPDGQLTLARKVPPLTSVWTVPRGQSGQLVKMNRKLSRTGMHNAFIARSTGFDGSPLQATYFESNPALKYGGPFGRVPIFIDAPLANSTAELARAAKAAAETEQRQRWQQINLTIVTNYALEVGDVITVPTSKGSITGPVTELSWSMVPAATMDITMTVDPFVLAQVA